MAAEAEFFAQKEDLVRQLAILESEKVKAQADLEVRELSIASNNLDRILDSGSIPMNTDNSGKDIHSVRDHLNKILSEMADKEKEKDVRVKRLEKGSELRNRLNLQMDAARSSLSLKKEEQKARIASYLEMKNRLDESRVQQLALAKKAETSQVEKKWLSKLNE